MIFKVVISKLAQKQLTKMPLQIQSKLQLWASMVERYGLEEIRTVPGFHDEPLQGKRKGQRSIRLNKAYRAIYRVLSEHQIEFACIEEVSKHEY